MTDVLIPAPGAAAIVGTFLSGELLVGSFGEGDVWNTFPLDLAGDTGNVVISPTVVAPTGELELLDGTAELIVTAPVDAPVVVEITGTLDLAADGPTVVAEKSTTVVVAASVLLELAGDSGTVFWQRNVVIPRPHTGLLCSPSVITGQHLTGEGASGDFYNEFVLSLPAELPKLIVDFNLVIKPTETLELELDGGEVRVNPHLIESECDDEQLVGAVCSDEDLELVVRTEEQLITALCAEEVMALAACVEEDLEPLVPLEA